MNTAPWKHKQNASHGVKSYCICSWFTTARVAALHWFQSVELRIQMFISIWQSVLRVGSMLVVNSTGWWGLDSWYHVRHSRLWATHWPLDEWLWGISFCTLYSAPRWYETLTKRGICAWAMLHNMGHIVQLPPCILDETLCSHGS